MALLTNLKAWWDFEEASGTRVDAHSTHDLTDNNTVTSTTGLVGNSAQFVRTNNESLSITDNADLSVGDYDWMYAGWVKFDSLTGAGTWGVLSKGTGTTNATLEYRLFYVPGTSRFNFRVGTGSSTVTVVANNFTTGTTGAWYFVEVWFQASANQIGIRVNRGTADTASFTGVPFDSAGTFRFGLDANSGDGLTGQLDSWGRWNEVLSSTDLDTLYASGAGVDYADISGGGAYTLTADSGTYTVTGQDASLLFGRKLAADSATYTLTGQDAGLRAARLLTADVASYTVTGQDAGLLAGRRLVADSAAYVVTGIDADLVYTTVGAYTLNAETGAYTVTGQDASLLYGRLLSADSAAYTLTGQDAGLLAGRRLAAETGAYAITGIAVDLVYTPVGGYTLNAESAAYTVTGQDANLLFGRRLSAESAAYELTGPDADLLRGYLLAADGATYTLSAQDAALLVGRVLSAASAEYILTGQAATLTYSGALLPVTPSERVYIVAADNRLYLVAAESRLFEVPAESRVYAVSA